ncbi:MAG TPA: DUF378 domain-containing protein [Patescibacteria group bacterium]|nr:DUF378 domain-containing protein [Patescibacteria group bacterium]
MKQYKPTFVWILIIGGLLWGYMGVTQTNLLDSFGMGVANIIEIIVGVVALLLAYMKLTMKPSKSKR